MSLFGMVCYRGSGKAFRDQGHPVFEEDVPPASTSLYLTQITSAIQPLFSCRGSGTIVLKLEVGPVPVSSPVRDSRLVSSQRLPDLEVSRRSRSQILEDRYMHCMHNIA
jgi:hypothetical protein